MTTNKKNFLVEIKVLDCEGRKIKGLIEEVSDSMQLKAIVEAGLLLRGRQKGSAQKNRLVFELHSCS
jgi:hypothetical protein